MRRFCFSLFGVLAGAAVLCAASAPEKATSVVRMDRRTGRLVRTVVAPKAEVNARQTEIRSVAEGTAKEHNIDPRLVHSVIEVESNWNPFAVSHKGAEGLMQLITATARRFGVANSFDSRENVSGGVRYLRYLLDLFKDQKLAVAAYNAGENAVLRYGGVPPYPETQNYVRLVSAKYKAAAAQPVAAQVQSGSSTPLVAQALSPAEAGAQPPEAASAEESYAPVTVYIDERGNWYVRTR